jgi:hypothetical protein
MGNGCGLGMLSRAFGPASVPEFALKDGYQDAGHYSKSAKGDANRDGESIQLLAGVLDKGTVAMFSFAKVTAFCRLRLMAE